MKAEADRYGDELTSLQIVDLFEKEYLQCEGRYKLLEHGFSEQHDAEKTVSKFSGFISDDGKKIALQGEGNGPIDSFFNALAAAGLNGYSFVNYHEHAISRGSASQGICYIELKNNADNKHIFGVGVHDNINEAALRGILCAVNRDQRRIK